MNIDYARRKERGGRGLIPPNNKQWDNEHHALDVREALELEVSAPLPEVADVYRRLLPTVSILAHGDLPAAATFLDHFRGDGRTSWSGLALTMEDSSIWVVYNDCHAPTRIRATLMEEFFHIHLAHEGSRIRVLPNSDGPNRTHDKGVEQAAFGSAAAVLVPYAELKALVAAGEAVAGIAERFLVSRQLVQYRLKVTKLYARTRRWRRS